MRNNLIDVQTLFPRGLHARLVIFPAGRCSYGFVADVKNRFDVVTRFFIGGLGGFDFDGVHEVLWWRCFLLVEFSRCLLTR